MNIYWNKEDGITTLEDKSLGCTQKAGTSTVVDVLKYGERIKKKGLNLLSAPGNDLVASSALAAAGCQLVLFTTGRGTPFGTFVPTMKVSTNTPLFESKPHWIDYNAGVLLEQSADLVLKDSWGWGCFCGRVSFYFFRWTGCDDAVFLGKGFNSS